MDWCPLCPTIQEGWGLIHTEMMVQTSEEVEGLNMQKSAEISVEVGVHDLVASYETKRRRGLNISDPPLNLNRHLESIPDHLHQDQRPSASHKQPTTNTRLVSFTQSLSTSPCKLLFQPSRARPYIPNRREHVRTSPCINSK